jgi:asparagine synthase (glutamine-hydrolysing)
MGHTRLSIIDLKTGAQPIANEDNTIWIVYNGEIYNFQPLRSRLIELGHVFRTHTDTEVIVHLYEEYGVDCLSMLRGMFAFALWDDRTKVLFCARDRVGIKPFYYADTGRAFLFGSEIKALLADPELDREVNRAAIDMFLTFTYLPGTETLFARVHKLEPGHYLLVRDGRILRRQYWDLGFVAPAHTLSFDEAAEALATLLRRTVKEHMVSDVPVGVLLSGGVDSTAILSCAVENTSKRIQTFTIGFEGAEFADERPYARMAADLYGTEHHAITFSSGDFSAFLDDYIWHMEEPVCEPPAIALHYVSKLAREFVTVVLSGEGGDEAFGGYQTYRNLLLLERFKSAVGKRASSGLSAAARLLSGVVSSARLAKYGPLLGVPLDSYYYSRRSSPFAFFGSEKSRFYTADMLAAAAGDRPGGLIRSLFARVGGQGALNQMLYIDTKTWLPDDLLVKADKITMANSLELRVPLLDHAVLEFAAGLPAEFKVSGLATKRILKKAFADRIPRPVIERKKMGFPVPIRQWLQRDLNGYVRDHLLSERAIGRGYFRRGAVEGLLTQCSRGRPVAHEVFSLLALELWHRRFVDPGPGSARAARGEAACAVR